MNYALSFIDKIIRGMAVPFFNYHEKRERLNDWASKKGDAGIKEYWLEKNQLSLDEKPTHIKDKNI